ncbi:hypothetical protein EPUS_09485 [Endocarpon pusillum Z07020]|uniref:Non-haem dioxygenase N-terminal domain-containing protein n=1 Tax=Endocarpon pusillum (strain Z07020 / HMAS-L-300199) TaxID=1263415 RepID=U1HK91_ENDPU|nr:uncharacterized protein EPUS_09485 [Endocarpon pusillum Z07020]ERF69364.1 hypothetical protein EPUS_09485 [Endocarpon pusillum Z07020]
MVANDALIEAFQAGLATHFLRIQDQSFPSELHDRMCDMTLDAFAWPPEVKSAMSMANSKHFLGFTGRGDELTNDHVDNREVFDFVLESNQAAQAYPGQRHTEYGLLTGCNQWPDPSIIGEDFRLTVEQYMCHMRKVYLKVMEQLEIALDLPIKALRKLDTPDALHRLKLIKYIPENEFAGTWKTKQGVGAHQDESGWLTFVQEIDEPGLQVHLRSGKEWIEVPFGPNTWGVNFGYSAVRHIEMRSCH